MQVCCYYWGRSLGVGEREGGRVRDQEVARTVASASHFPPRRGEEEGRSPLVSRTFRFFFLRRPFFWADASLANRAGAGFQPQLAPLASV